MILCVYLLFLIVCLLLLLFVCFIYNSFSLTPNGILSRTEDLAKTGTCARALQ